MFLDGRWYTVTLAAPPLQASPADALDVSRLQDTVLGPLLGIGDVRSDRRIDFVGGARGSAELERLVGSGSAAVAFSMHPVSVDDLMAISDAGGIMPPKSTWFEPKLRDGLLVTCHLQRIFNFSAGPAVLPLPVLEEAQRDLIALPGVGMSVMEISHRSKTFEGPARPRRSPTCASWPAFRRATRC